MVVFDCRGGSPWGVVCVFAKAAAPLSAGGMPENLDTLPLAHEEIQDFMGGCVCVFEINFVV